MEKALGNGHWLTGEQFTLADAGLLSFFYRLEMLQAKGLWADHYPRVTEWYARAKERPSFRQAIIDPIPEKAFEDYRRVAEPLWPKVDTAFRKALASI